MQQLENSEGCLAVAASRIAAVRNATLRCRNGVFAPQTGAWEAVLNDTKRVSGRLVAALLDMRHTLL